MNGALLSKRCEGSIVSEKVVLTDEILKALRSQPFGEWC